MLLVLPIIQRKTRSILSESKEGKRQLDPLKKKDKQKYLLTHSQKQKKK
jgi:hypothetical protein